MSDSYEESGSPGAGNGPNGAGFAGAAFGDGALQQELRRRELAVRAFVTAHPVPVLLGALAAGFVLARLIRGDDR